MTRLRICYFGGYDQDHVRNRVMIAGLRAQGAQVAECYSRHPLWVVRVGSLMRQYRRVHRTSDLILVGAAGHAYVPLAWILARLTRKPLVFDAFVSTFEIWQEQTRSARPRGVAGHLAWAFDALSARLADRVLLDTEEHADYFCRTFHLPAHKVTPLPVGSDMTPAPSSGVPRPPAPLRVVFVGSFLPLHGADVIRQAAALLQDAPGILVELAGSGTKRGLISPADYRQMLQQADIALGAFGTTPKAQRVIPCKVYDALAAGVVVVTGETPAIRRLLRHGDNALLVTPGDAHALTEAIRRLHRDPDLRARLAAAGQRTFEERSTPVQVGRVLTRICVEVLAARAAP